MDAARRFARGIQAGDRRTAWGEDLSIGIDRHAAHGMVQRGGLHDCNEGRRINLADKVITSELRVLLGVHIAVVIADGLQENLPIDAKDLLHLLCQLLQGIGHAGITLLNQTGQISSSFPL